MAYYYMDTDTGSDVNSGATWALAKLTLEGLLAVMAAGDTGYVQGLTVDTSASVRTFTSPGTVNNPCKIIGVKDGTTNVGASVVASDLAVTLPVVGTNAKITVSGHAQYSNVHINGGGQVWTGGITGFELINGKFTYGDRLRILTSPSLFYFLNSTVEVINTYASWDSDGISTVTMDGCLFLFTAAAPVIRSTSSGVYNFRGCDLSGLTTTFIEGGGRSMDLVMTNCKIPSTFSLLGSNMTYKLANAKLIGCSSTTSQAATSSIQDYQYEDAYGNVDLETVIVRTGGADDGATGAFSYAMTPKANATLEGSGANLKSPWMSVWVAGGATTLTVYIANDSASTDYLQDEAWVEFYTPSATDSAQHDQNFDPADARLLDSTTIVTDDTGSAWGTGGNNHQKFSTTVTTGFEGFAYARLHLAKREATPTTLYLDPMIEVT